jgi:hypothetical protein
MSNQLSIGAQTDHSSNVRTSLFDKFSCVCVGALATAPVVYAGRIGNTYIPAVFLAGILFLIIETIRNSKRTVALSSIDESVWLFCAVALLSMLCTLVYSMLGILDSDALAVPFKGYLVLICLLALYLFTVRFWKAKEWLFIGIAIGIIVNFAICLISFVAFNSGGYFTMYWFFPQESLQVSAPYAIWGSTGIPRELLIAQYRPQGLFREASHVMIFIISMVPIVVYSVKNKFLRYAVVLFALFSTVTSKSPNALFFALEALIIFAIFSSNRQRKHREGRRIALSGATWITVILIIAVVLLVLLLRQDLVMNVMSQLETGLTDLDISDTSDQGTLKRWDLMGKAVSLLGLFPMGAGWNLETTIMEGMFGAGAASSHTIILKYLIEIGPIGLISYVFLIYRHSACLLHRGSTGFQKLLGLAVIFMFISQATNGVSLAPWMWLLLGMAQAESLSLERISKK